MSKNKSDWALASNGAPVVAPVVATGAAPAVVPGGVPASLQPAAGVPAVGVVINTEIKTRLDSSGGLTIGGEHLQGASVAPNAKRVAALTQEFQKALQSGDQKESADRPPGGHAGRNRPVPPPPTWGARDLDLCPVYPAPAFQLDPRLASQKNK